MTTFVSVGNATQPFGRLVHAVIALAPTLPQPVIIQHGATPVAAAHCDCRSYVSMTEFESLVARAPLLILHAGAGSVIHAVRAGKLPIVMPRSAGLGEHVDDHQMEFAIELERAGKIVLVREPADLAAAVESVLSRPIQAQARSSGSAMTRLVSDALSRCALGER